MGKTQSNAQYDGKDIWKQMEKNWLGKLKTKHPHLALHMISNAFDVNQKLNQKGC